jgi:hypothetical protein
MERRRLASGAHRQKRLLFERCLSRANGRVICLPINKSGRGCDRETHRRLPVPGADATDRCRCAIQIRKSLEQKASQRTRNQPEASGERCHHQPTSQPNVGWLVGVRRPRRRKCGCPSRGEWQVRPRARGSNGTARHTARLVPKFGLGSQALGCAVAPPGTGQGVPSW